MVLNKIIVSNIYIQTEQRAHPDRHYALLLVTVFCMKIEVARKLLINILNSLQITLFEVSSSPWVRSRNLLIFLNISSSKEYFSLYFAPIFFKTCTDVTFEKFPSLRRSPLAWRTFFSNAPTGPKFLTSSPENTVLSMNTSLNNED